MIATQEIRPLTDFLRNHKAHVARLKETGTPEVLTVNGKAEVVVQDAQSYQNLLDRLQRMETIDAIREASPARIEANSNPLSRSSRK